MTIAQNGATFSGSMLFPHNWSDHQEGGNGPCSWIDNGPVRRIISGTISGSTMNIDACFTEQVDSVCPAPFPPWLVSGSTVTGAFPEGDHAIEHGSFTLVRQSSNLQGDVTGWWSGNMIDTFSWGPGSPKSCTGGSPASFTTSTPLILAIAHNGSNFAGSMTVQHDWHDHMFSDGPDKGKCMWIDHGSISIPISGTVSGSTITMAPIDSSFSSILGVSDATITGSFRADTQSASFTLIRHTAGASRRRTSIH